MLMLLAITAAVGVAAHHQHLSHHVYVPVADFSIPLGPVWYGLLFLIIAGAVNGVNLTDGVDGLAAGTSIIALATLTAMAVTIYIRSATHTHGRVQNRLDVAFIGAALIGAAIGFLWFNAHPAEVFMGDTGAFALGGAIAAMAIMMKVELLLLLVGGIFAVTSISVILQVASFKYWGRRIFLMAPIHNHFEIFLSRNHFKELTGWVAKARMTVSGTEATMHAMRIARALVLSTPLGIDASGDIQGDAHQASVLRCRIRHHDGQRIDVRDAAVVAHDAMAGNRDRDGIRRGGKHLPLHTA